MEGSAVSEGKCQKTELRGDEGIATGLVGRAVEGGTGGRRYCMSGTL